MAVETQIWSHDLAQNIYANNRWALLSKKDDEYVTHSQVHLPQSGAKPEVQKNRSVIPATPVTRVDTIVSYAIDEYTTTPTRIRDIEEVEVSYNKRQDVLSDHQMELDTWIALNILYNWAPSQAARIAATTGDAGAAIANGATGNRKRVTRFDILALKEILDGDDVPSEGRNLLIDSTNLNWLLRDDKITSKDYSDAYNQETGSIGKLYNFNIHVRSKTGAYTAGNVVKDPFAVSAADDNSFCLAWHPMFVRRALGEVKAFANIDDPQNYGSIFSALVRQGGSKAYESQKGVAALVEAASA